MGRIKTKRIAAWIIAIAMIFSMGFALSNIQAASAGTSAKNWAVKIANDNTYKYGTSKSHKCDKITPKKYVSTTFVKAAYAHGAGDSEMKDWCGNNKYGLVDSLHKAMKNSKKWNAKGAIKQSKMKVGDVIFYSNNHCAIYAGNGKIVHARGNKGGKDDIAVTKISSGWTDVMRHK